MQRTSWFLAAAAVALAVPVLASPVSLLDGYAVAARQENPGFKGFSAEKGKAFYALEHTSPEGRVSSCATCHSANPAGPGRTRTGKVIQPLAPSANPERFQDGATVEKWFLRNCQDVLQRACTAEEKGNFIQHLMTTK